MLWSRREMLQRVGVVGGGSLTDEAGEGHHAEATRNSLQHLAT